VLLWRKLGCRLLVIESTAPPTSEPPVRSTTYIKDYYPLLLYQIGRGLYIVFNDHFPIATLALNTPSWYNNYANLCIQYSGRSAELDRETCKS